MTPAQPFTWPQISPPEALRPSRLRALRAQRRDKRLAPQALRFAAAAIKPAGIPLSTRTAPSASPPPRGEGPGEGGTTEDQEAQT